MNIFKNLSAKNKILVIATIMLFAIAVPLTIMQSLNRQTTKQRASNDSLGFSTMLTPSSLTKNIGEDIEADIHLLNSQRKEISAVDIVYGGYNASMFESVVFQPSSVGTFTDILNNSGRYVGVVHPEGEVSYADITLGTIKFIKSKEAGSINLNLNIRVNVPGIHDAVSFDNISGQYTIETAKASSNTTGGGIILSNPTPTSILIQTPTVTLTPTLIPTATPIPTNSSSDIDYNACLVSCNDLEDTTDALACIQNCKTQYGK